MADVFAGAGGGYYPGAVGVYRRKGRVVIEFSDNRPSRNVINFTFTESETRSLIQLLEGALGAGELVGMVKA